MIRSEKRWKHLSDIILRAEITGVTIKAGFLNHIGATISIRT